ncbi:hypothetical protein G3O06_20510 [Burkholderia sp. Ac-20345]|uniref:hypothetical protein n=1 Tax=Burkholderia sp. Ac-20345 TaxID=2703891 RepID=UPI00197C1481|nr:hypothetical protein [Burkholderia sp. Ac-20345]MBN3779922.1 hypothetical protein [Burkholderia sp. Ac-20345]
MPRYRYTGPATGLTIGQDEFMLYTGATLELPDCPPVATLVALKRLTPVEEAAPTKPKASTKPSDAPAPEGANGVPPTVAPVAAQIKGD